MGWGDSLTYSLTKVDGVWRQAKPTWLDTIGEDLHVQTVNFGVPSQGSAEIAVRQGGLKPAVTLINNRIPSGSTAAVPVLAISPIDGWTQYAKAGTMEMHGTLAGVSGNLQHTMSSGAEIFGFVPDRAPESVVPVPAESVFSSDIGGANYRACTQIIWAGGTNNGGGQKTAIMRDIASMVDSLSEPKKYLIVGGAVPSVRSELSIVYGSRFVDLRSWLVTDGLAAVRLPPPTPADIAAVEAGDIAPALTVDGTHFTQAAYTAIGHHLASIINGLV